MFALVVIGFLHISFYLGPAAAEDLLLERRGDVLQEKTEAANNIRRTVFDRFFTLLHTGLEYVHQHIIL